MSQTGNGADLDLAINQHRNAIGRRPKCVYIVRHHEDGEAKALLQVANELVELSRSDGIQTSGWLVEKQELRIKRECSREASAFAHAAG